MHQLVQNDNSQAMLLLLVSCLMSKQHASVSQGQICSENCTCCHTKRDNADQIRYRVQSQYTDSSGQTIPSTDSVTSGMSGRVATGVPIFKSLARLDVGPTGKAGIESRSAAFKVDTLPVDQQGLKQWLAALSHISFKIWYKHCHLILCGQTHNPNSIIRQSLKQKVTSCSVTSSFADAEKFHFLVAWL